jgi:hypothetical protein
MDKTIYDKMKDCQKEAIKLCKEVTAETGFEFSRESIASIGTSMFISSKYSK